MKCALLLLLFFMTNAVMMPSTIAISFSSCVDAISVAKNGDEWYVYDGIDTNAIGYGKVTLSSNVTGIS